MRSNTKAMMAIVMVAILFSSSMIVCTDDSDATSTGTCTLIVSTSPYESGIMITADSVTSSYSDVTATTNSQGVATLNLSCSTMWYIYGAQVGDLVSQLRTFDPQSAATYSLTLNYVERFVYTLTFNSTNFSSNPSEALTYAADAAGFTSVTSWTSNALIDYCYYGVFASDGSLIGELNPNNLTQFVNGTSASSYITSNNVMWCIPTLYISSTSTSLTISNDHTTGIAYAHTIDSYIYEFYGLGVYEGSVLGGKLMSVSGATPTTSTTRSTFRTDAANNNVDNGVAMQWNFYQYQLYKYIVLFSGESFDSQGTFGNGNVGGSSATTTGTLNTSGMFFGSTSSTTAAVKCYIENAWGSVYEFVDDCVASARVIYAGQNSAASITDTTSNKTSLVTISSSGYPGAISTGASTFGIGTATGGSSSTCTFDYQYSSTGTYLLIVGGRWYSGVNAGVSYLSANNFVSNSGSDLGSRLAYVYDADAASLVTTSNITFESNNGADPTVVVNNNGSTICVWPSDPVKTGYVFTGWFIDTNCTTLFDIETVINADITLYAGYEVSLVFQTEPSAVANVTASTSFDNAISCSAASSTNYSSVIWDFGDGSTSTAIYCIHMYGEPGTYTVTLTAVNDYGSDVTSEEVTVHTVGSNVDGTTTGSEPSFLGIVWYVWAIIAAVVAVIVLAKMGVMPL